jgi:predicted PurR-regulated permease PerM
LSGLNVLLIVLGVAWICVTLWDVFNDLFHPAARSAFGDWIARRLFNLLRRWPRLHGLAGPLSVVLIILSWVIGLVLAFSLIFSPFYPSQFLTSTGDMPAQSPHWLTAIYFSFQTLITLGYGDLIPSTTAIRFAATSEALIGFGLLTASISSIVLLYPALARSRALARSIAHVVQAERKSGLSIVRSSGEAHLLSLAAQITQARIDLIHFPIIYYFAVSNSDASLAKWIFEAERLADEGTQLDCEPRVRLAACSLELALDELADIMAKRFLQHAPKGRDHIFRAFAKDHRVAIDQASA